MERHTADVETFPSLASVGAFCTGPLVAAKEAGKQALVAGQPVPCQSPPLHLARGGDCDAIASSQLSSRRWGPRLADCCCLACRAPRPRCREQARQLSC